MPGFTAIGFLSPWLLLGLLILPILWLILRAVPPAPLRRRFPAVVLLLGLQDRETSPDRTPWWLLLLRLLAVAAAIIGFANPVLNPENRVSSDQPLLITLDNSWASAQSWPARKDKLAEMLAQSALDARPVALVSLTQPPLQDSPLAFVAAQDLMARLEGINPDPWAADYSAWAQALAQGSQEFDTLWLSDGLDHSGRSELWDVLQSKGNVAVVETAAPVLALAPPQIENGEILLTVLRSIADTEQNFSLAAFGPDPTGIERALARAEGSFAVAETQTTITLNLPSELRNRIRRFAITNLRSAGAVTLTDDSLQRRKVALIASAPEQEGQALVSPLHFLRKALVPTANVIEASFTDSLNANPDVLILADVGRLTVAEADAVTAWVNKGGLLLRFAGPQLAATTLDQAMPDPLLPVRLRPGGRSLGGALSWGNPKRIKDFEQGSPFFGLQIPEDVTISSQVVAQPGPNLSERVMARLQDGTPLVTGKDMGDGRVVLVHVTANANWSTLPLSGLFVQMLERLAVSTNRNIEAAELAGLIWTPEKILDGFGALQDADSLAGVKGETLALGIAQAALPPGIYGYDARRVALNVIAQGEELRPSIWPANSILLPLQKSAEFSLKPALIALSLILLSLDILATLLLGGRLRGPLPAPMAAISLAFVILEPTPAAAQSSDALAIAATNSTVLAYVATGDQKVDEVSHAGLLGLSTTLFARTAVEPSAPIAIDIEKDDLAFYPFLYWPVTESQAQPSSLAVERLNTYLRSGGLILFDTRDSDLGSAGTPNGRKLKKIATALDIPALEPVPEDHVLTRSFYLLQRFPGRFDAGSVWVEAAPVDAVKTKGVPFRNLNDGVTPVVIGGNDWAAAWAMNAQGQFIFPVGRGIAGERQREIALRFGVNLIMHVMTGNYKSDQVHVPALLDRLGQ